jgi:uncharacterized protein
MENFTPLPALAGGAIIGLSASMMLLLNGRIAGISGIAGGLFNSPGQKTDRILFLCGLITGGVVLLFLYPEAFTMELSRSTPALAAAGLMVGLGTRIGSGCTSGHGVCGLSRLSPRSLAATLTFMAAGFATASGITLFLGGTI